MGLSAKVVRIVEKHLKGLELYHFSGKPGVNAWARENLVCPLTTRSRMKMTIQPQGGCCISSAARIWRNRVAVDSQITPYRG